MMKNAVALAIRLKTLLVRLLEGLLILLMGGLVVDVLWQVFTRYALRDPSSWTDELATLLIIWVALIGSSVAFIRKSHLGVDFLVEKFPERTRRGIEAGIYAVIGAFAVVILIIGGIKLVALTLLTHQVSPALGVKMGHVYLALPVSGVFILLFALETMLEKLAGANRRGKGKERR